MVFAVSHDTVLIADGGLATELEARGHDLSDDLWSARLLVDEANANYPQVSQLIDQAGPFLEAQIRAGADIKSLSDGLALLRLSPPVPAMTTTGPAPLR